MQPIIDPQEIMEVATRLAKARHLRAIEAVAKALSHDLDWTKIIIMTKGGIRFEITKPFQIYEHKRQKTT